MLLGNPFLLLGNRVLLLGNHILLLGKKKPHQNQCLSQACVIAL